MDNNLCYKFILQKKILHYYINTKENFNYLIESQFHHNFNDNKFSLSIYQLIVYNCNSLKYAAFLFCHIRTIKITYAIYLNIKQINIFVELKMIIY